MYSAWKLGLQVYSKNYEGEVIPSNKIPFVWSSVITLHIVPLWVECLMRFCVLYVQLPWRWERKSKAKSPWKRLLDEFEIWNEHLNTKLFQQLTTQNFNL